MILKIAAVLDGYSHRKDNSYTLRFVSGLEISKEERDVIDDSFQKEGWLIFASNEDEVVIPKEKASTGRKSPMQILSARMFVAWKQRSDKGKTKLDFESWYKAQLEAVGNQYLETLDN
jgi:hypothetical protein